MQKNIKEALPQWVHTKQDRNLTLSNDLDSLITCALLKHIFGYEINHFYAFVGMATLDTTDKRKTIGVDMAINKGYTYDNHLTRLNSQSSFNPDSANLNLALGITNDSYNQKFSMSTLIFLWGLYDMPLPPTEEGRKILLGIDSGHKGYRQPQYRHILTGWLEKMGLTELETTLQDNPYSEMERFGIEHELDTSIVLNASNQLEFEATGRNGNKETGLDLEWLSHHLGFPIELPDGEFEVIGLLHMKDYKADQLKISTLENAFSHAFTYKDKIRLSNIGGESA